MTLITTPRAVIGTSAPDLTLPGTDGKTYQLASFTNPILVVIFTCNHCPNAQAVWPRLIRLAHDYRPKGVDFVAINPNDDKNYPEDSFENMQSKAGEWGINFPYLRDESQAVAKTYGAVCTPDIFVYDRARKLAYRGRFDDHWQDEARVTRHDLRAALDALLAGNTVAEPQHPSMGCSIKWQ